ncbi:MAG TPA: hypothetical protein VFN13_07435 [Rudaea sp.]|nr:hypothetical protein [Rudaea sp.]
MNATLIIAWLLPLAAAAAAWMVLDPQRRPGWIASAFGHGLVFGMLLAGGATALLARSDTTHALAHAAPWLAVFAAICGVIAWRRIRAHARLPAIAVKVNKWTIVLSGLALVSLVWRGWIALREIVLRPTFPWDAWDAWAVKSKSWFLLGRYVPFVSLQDWLRNTGADVHTGIAWGYPTALAWLQVWFASAAGGWIEPMVNLPWLALWLGLLFGHYGQWRALGLNRTRALIGVYVLGSLPLLDVHVALAGYADLWIACVLGFGVLAWVRWIEQRDRAQLAIAAICALLLPALKLEGGVWLLLLAGVAAFGALPRRWRWYVVGVGACVMVLAIAFGNLVVPLVALGWTHVDAQALEVPVIGRLALGWHPAAFEGVVKALFAQRNWNLLWWLAPLIALWRWRELRAHESLRVLGIFLIAGFAFLLFLFLFTDAARWAESYTAINRLIMHLVPATVTFLALLCRGELFAEFPRTRPEPVALPDPQ